MSPTAMRRSPFVILISVILSVATSLCAQQSNSVDSSRWRALNRTMESAPPQQRLAWNALVIAYTTFRDASAAHASCLKATECASQMKADDDSYFLSMAEGRFEPGFPSFSADDLQNADATLNAAYEKALAGLPAACKETHCLSQDAFREIQRDWIRYRDAWVTFAALRWPQVTPESWLTLLTRARTAEIN